MTWTAILLKSGRIVVEARSLQARRCTAEMQSREEDKREHMERHSHAMPLRLRWCGSRPMGFSLRARPRPSDTTDLVYSGMYWYRPACWMLATSYDTSQMPCECAQHKPSQTNVMHKLRMDGIWLRLHTARPEKAIRSGSSWMVSRRNRRCAGRPEGASLSRMCSRRCK